MTTESLKSQVEYFLNAKNKNRDEVREFLDQMSLIGDPIIFGGMLRDLALNGNWNFVSDVDVVLANSDQSVFQTKMETRTCTRNAFGGYRLNLTEWPVDIWRLEDTWAFKQGFVDLVNEKSLLETTFFNWDAVIYNYNRKTISCSDKYFRELKNRILDINFAPNPNVSGALKRISKFLRNENAKCTRKVCTFFVTFSESKASAKLPAVQQEELRSLAFQMKLFLDSKSELFQIQPKLTDQTI